MQEQQGGYVSVNIENERMGKTDTSGYLIMFFLSLYAGNAGAAPADAVWILWKKRFSCMVPSTSGPWNVKIAVSILYGVWRSQKSKQEVI